MVQIFDILLEAKQSVLPSITLQQAHDQKLFGPVYHGSNESGHDNIHSQGFKVDNGLRQNGYETSSYADGKPAPIHHLGYGVYFTTSKSIAKKFNGNSVKNLEAFYLDIPNHNTINFASPNTMMKWWVQHGYDFNWDNIKGEKNFSNPSVMRERERATHSLTQHLAAQYDAVWFKGKTIFKTLDGDQVCIFKPEGKIFRVDNAGIDSLQMGAKVRCKSVEECKQAIMKLFNLTDEQVPVDEDNTFYILGRHLIYVPKDPKNTGTIVSKRSNNMKNIDYYDIKWKKGGVKYNYSEDMLDLA